MANLIGQILALVLSLLPKDKFKEIVDSVLDKIEEKVAASEGKIDDALILPLTRKARELLDVPDDDDIN